MKTWKPSPLYYNGNKFTLLDWLNNFIPKNKNGTFHDVFGGSGTMCLNFANEFKEAVYYEPVPYVFKMFEWAKQMTPEKVEELKKEVYRLDNKYNMICNWVSNSERDREVNGGSNKIPQYQGWLAFLENEKIGQDSPAELLFIANLFSFSNTLQMSPKTGLLGKSWGAYNFNPDNLKDFYYLNKVSDKIKCKNQGFQEFDISQVDKENDFIYLDPPYLGTEANYNKFWTDAIDDQFLAFCESLTAAGIKWGMSNIFENKGFINHKLKEWAYSNKLIVHMRDKKYTLNGVTGDAIEVFITNQDYDETKKRINIFELL